jgi:RNA methyltransferase, TrmH family
MFITSLQHPLVKHFVSLRKDSAYRKEKKSLVLIGDHLVREYPYKIKCLLSKDPSHLQSEFSYLVTEEILQKISGLAHFSGMIAEVDFPQEKNVDDQKKVFILDQIQDPGNLGTLIRSAAAFGWDAVIATPGTVDFFNDKALRASQGAIFRMPFAYKSPDEILSWVQRKQVHLWVADMHGAPIEKQTFQTPIAVVLSNEGSGVASWAKKNGKSLSIPLQNNIESLNVAIAGAILLYGIHAKL